jgi:hypothetical protein
MNTNGANSNQSPECMEAGLEHALRNFRANVHAWSEAELSRPRAISPASHRHGWRFAAAWALGCLIAAGTLSAGLYQYHRSQLLTSMVHQPPIQQEQLQARPSIVSAPAVQGDEGLMAAVDNDVSRPVPSAMEPLAQLMDEGGNQ